MGWFYNPLGGVASYFDVYGGFVFLFVILILIIVIMAYSAMR